jgi:hypothetical protein
MTKYDTTSDRLAVATEKGIFISNVDRNYVLPRASVRPTHAESTLDLAHLQFADGELLRSIKLLDVTGRVLGEYSEPLDMSKLGSGLYLAIVTTTKSVYRLRSLIVK